MGYGISEVGAEIKPLPDHAFRREQDLGSDDKGYRGMTPNFSNQGRYLNDGSGRQSSGEDVGVVAYEVFDFHHDVSKGSSVTRNVGRKVDVYD